MRRRANQVHTRESFPAPRPGGYARPLFNARGWTMAEALAVIALVAVVLLIGAVSVYAGKRAAELRQCQDQMHALQAELQNYYAQHSHQYPADQTAFNQFLQDRTYFPSGEPHCPWDAAKATHYTYQYNPAVNSSAEGIKILCPVPKSDHGSVP